MLFRDHKQIVKHYIKTSLDNAAQAIRDAYDSTLDRKEALDYVNALDASTATGWIKFLDNFSSKRSNTNAAKINTYTTVKYSDYIKDLGRGHLAREDFESVLSNRHKFIIIKYTDNDTYLSKDPTFEPVEELSGASLFEGL